MRAWMRVYIFVAYRWRAARAFTLSRKVQFPALPLVRQPNSRCFDGVCGSARAIIYDKDGDAETTPTPTPTPTTREARQEFNLPCDNNTVCSVPPPRTEWYTRLQLTPSRRSLLSPGIYGKRTHFLLNLRQLRAKISKKRGAERKLVLDFQRYTLHHFIL